MRSSSRAWVSILALGLGGCGIFSPGDDGPPEFVRFEISEGRCPGCPLPGPFVAPDADGSLTLRQNVSYTLRAYVRTGGDSDRCIYSMVGISWFSPPTRREFNCTTETESMQIDYQVLTDNVLVRNYDSHFLRLSLSEYDIESRTMLNRQELQTFPVRFDPPLPR